MQRPAKPDFTTNYSEFIIAAGNGWLEWEALLDMAQEDLKQCND